MAAISELQKDPRAALQRFKARHVPSGLPLYAVSYTCPPLLQDDTALMTFLQAFMALMGDHLTKLDTPAKATDVSPAMPSSSSAAPPAKAPSKAPRPLIQEVIGNERVPDKQHAGPSAEAAIHAPHVGLSPEDIERAAQFSGADEEVRRVLSQPALAAILSDPVIQAVLEECRTDGSRVRKFMQDPVIAAKLRTLADNGLIRIVS